MFLINELLFLKNFLNLSFYPIKQIKIYINQSSHFKSIASILLHKDAFYFFIYIQILSSHFRGILQIFQCVFKDILSLTHLKLLKTNIK